MASRSSWFRIGLALLLVPLLAIAGAAALAWWWLERPLPLAAPSVELSIEPGDNPREVATAWVGAGVQTSPRLLYEWFRWSGQARRIRALHPKQGPGGRLCLRRTSAPAVRGDM